MIISNYYINSLNLSSYNGISQFIGNNPESYNVVTSNNPLKSSSEYFPVLKQKLLRNNNKYNLIVSSLNKQHPRTSLEKVDFFGDDCVIRGPATACTTFVTTCFCYIDAIIISTNRYPHYGQLVGNVALILGAPTGTIFR